MRVKQYIIITATEYFFAQETNTVVSKHIDFTKSFKFSYFAIIGLTYIKIIGKRPTYILVPNVAKLGLPVF